MFHASCSRGFTLLFAVLLGSLLFSLGISIAHIAIKEVVLASAGKASEVAFYAADAGIECALYWDFLPQPVFPDSSSSTWDPDLKIKCSGADTQLTITKETASAATTTFSVTLKISQDPLILVCADVAVGKYTSGATVIESRGHNDCGSGDNPARVERALRVRY